MDKGFRIRASTPAENKAAVSPSEGTTMSTLMLVPSESLLSTEQGASESFATTYVFGENPE
jgi:hypothetical protein